MTAALTVNLTATQQQELIKVRDHHPRPYLREKAAAILMVAQGQSATHVATAALWRKREPETICRWCHAYLGGGLAALFVAKGRGRKPAFSPTATRPRQRHQPGTATGSQ